MKRRSFLASLLAIPAAIKAACSNLHVLPTVRPPTSRTEQSGFSTFLTFDFDYRKYDPHQIHSQAPQDPHPSP